MSLEMDFETKSPIHFVLSVCASCLWLRMHAPNFLHACCYAYLPPHQDELFSSGTTKQNELYHL